MTKLAHSPLVLLAVLVCFSPSLTAQTSAKSDNTVSAPGSALTSKTDSAGPANKTDVPNRPDKAARDAARAQYKAGIKYGRANLYRQALQSFQQAINFDPDFAEAYLGLGQANFDLGRYNDAIKAYEKVVKLNPNLTEAYTGLGQAYIKSKEDPKASAAPEPNEVVPVATPAKPKSAPAENGTEKTEPVVPEKTDRTPDPTRIYRVGVGDVLDIRIPGADSDASTLFTVSSSGQVEHPLLGHTSKVLGLTTDEISELFGNELKRRSIRDANPQVGVRDYNSHTILISGLVKEPGTKILRREAIPLYVVLADAQPLPEAAFVTVLSQHSVKSRTAQLSDPEQTSFLVVPGDVITVQLAAKQFFYVGGEVRKPGELPFRSGLTLTQAILSAGGVTPRGEKIELSRGRGDGLLNLQEFKLKDINKGKVPDPLVEPGDRITVLP